MRQKLYIDIRIYDENMKTIFKKHRGIAESAIKQAEEIMKHKIRGR